MPILHFVRPLVSAGLTIGLAQLLQSERVASHAVKYKLFGALLWLVAIQAIMLGLLFLAAMLFFMLAGAEAWIRPSLITALVLFLVGTLAGWEGWVLWRRQG